MYQVALLTLDIKDPSLGKSKTLHLYQSKIFIQDFPLRILQEQIDVMFAVYFEEDVEPEDEPVADQVGDVEGHLVRGKVGPGLYQKVGH